MIKVPPNSETAEQSILGCILIDRECLITIGDVLTEKDFYIETHAKIFETMLGLYKEDKPVDLVTLKEKLEDKKILDKVGGIVYLTDLVDSVPTTANVLEYAQIVKNKSILRKLGRSANEIMGYSYNENESLTELLEKSEQSLFRVTQSFIKRRLTPIQDILTSRYEEFAELHENPERVKDKKLHIGFKDIDYKLGGLKAGDMVILAARPSMGKTAFSLNIAQNMGFKGKNIAIFSLEMSKEQLTDRMISSALGVNAWKLAKGELTDEEFGRMGEAMEKLGDAKIFIDDSVGGNLIELKSKCRRLKMDQGLDLIIIDYLQLMTNGNSINRVQEVSEISRGIKSLARELEVPIIALSQLSRTVETRPDKRPIMSDLRESGSIEQDADIILMLYREEYYDEFTEKKGITEVSIRKNRNGPTGTVELMFDRSLQRFIEIDRNLKMDE